MGFFLYLISWAVISLSALALLAIPPDMLLSQRLGVMLAIAAFVNLFSAVRAMDR